jgi:tRNA threonylcarbamoyladenosine biosynthesis protein TsaE
MSKLRTLSLPDLAATQAFGERLSKHLRSGDIVCLEGGLGVGKTTLARVVIACLTGVLDAPSPTYTIIQTYETREGVAIWHADLYRVENRDEFDEIGLEDAFDDAITLIEWPDRLEDQIPPDRLVISLNPSADGMDTGREVRITGWGEWESRIDNI